MAARTRKIFHDEDTRKRIKAAAIIDRLQNFALGSNPDAMSRAQIAAAVGLLHKVLANPVSVDVTCDKSTTYVLRAPEQSESTEAWLRDYAPKHIAEQRLGPLPAVIREK
jgi:hypothetical protein